MIDWEPVKLFDPIARRRPSRAAKVKGGGALPAAITLTTDFKMRGGLPAGAALPLTKAGTAAGWRRVGTAVLVSTC